jgi:serine/threonine protein kinase
MHETVLTPGTVLKSRFRIVKELGSGTFGRTYLALDQDRVDRDSTVKQLRIHDERHMDKQASLFEREARQLLVLGKQKSIPELLGYFADHNGYYLAYEYIEGEDLGNLLSGSYRWTIEEVKAFWSVMRHTLDYIHSLGVVHRDIKPSNIIKTNDHPGYALIDFGASILQPAGHGTLIGTPGYAPLQQLAIGVASKATDLHGLSMTTIHILTGQPPASLYASHGSAIKGLWLADIHMDHLDPRFIEEVDSFLIDEIYESDSLRKEQRASGVAAKEADDVLQANPTTRSSTWA